MPIDTPDNVRAPQRRSDRRRASAAAEPGASMTRRERRMAEQRRQAQMSAGQVSEPVVASVSEGDAGLSPSAAGEQRAQAELSSSSDLFSAAFEALRTDEIVVPQMAMTRAGSSQESASDEHQVSRRPRPLLRKFAAAGATLGIMGIAGLMAVSMTLPAEAVAATQGAEAIAARSLLGADGVPGEAADDDEIQAYVASSDVKNTPLVREDNYDTMSMVDLAAEEGIKYSNSLYENDTNAAIQWPFPVGVGMSSGYGARWGTLHQGIDLVPGEGAPIQVIADGVERKATENGGGYGVTAYVDHVIDGKVVTSHYAHMQHGSLRVQPGQKLKVGDIIGNVGNTGHSFGAHLHFEIIINGSPIDPLPWMKQNAGRYDGVTSP